MVLDNAGNFDRQSVTGTVGTNDPETINVTDASLLPDPSVAQYNITIWDFATYQIPGDDPNREIMTVTSYDTGNNTITVQRGQEDTSISSHPDTSQLMSTITAKMISDIDTYLEEIADFSASPSEVTAPVNNSEVNTQSVSVENSVTMYVRSAGSDSNDGLSSGNPKATIQAAIADAPLTPNDDSLVVDVGDGTFPGVDISELSVSHVEIEGNGTANTTIDATSGTTISHAINCSNQPRTVVRDCSLVGGSGGCFRAWMGELRFENIDASSDQADGADHCGQINQQAYFNDDPNCTYTHDGDGSGALINVVTGAAQFAGDSYTGAGLTDKIIRVKEGGEAQVVGSTIQGVGSGTTGFGILARHNSSIKVEDVTVDGVARAFSRSASGQIRVQGTNTLTDVSVRFGGAQGDHFDVENDEYVSTFPVNTSTPSVAWGGGAYTGAYHHNSAVGLPEVYSATFDATVPLGREVIEDVTVAFDSGETKNNIGINANPDDVVDVTAVPANAPGNDHGYSVDQIYYQNSSDTVRCVVTETEGDGGGDCRIIAFRYPGY